MKAKRLILLTLASPAIWLCCVFAGVSALNLSLAGVAIGVSFLSCIVLVVDYIKNLIIKEKQ